MDDLIIIGGAAAAGYVLAVFSWPSLRTSLVGAEQELASLKARAAALETRLRTFLGGHS